ncbi:MAG: 50S ribosomal protein L11 methyltransferase [Negativicutes bacterium]|jgi:ribosomal protein L11 methyltransferase
MKWLEYILQVNDEAVEAAAELLRTVCPGGVVIDDPKLVNRYRAEKLWDYSDLPDAPDNAKVLIKGYLPVDDRLEDVKLILAEQVARRLTANFGASCSAILPAVEIDEVDWATAWKKYFHVLKIGNGMVIKPTWEEYIAKAGEHVIDIDPGMAFGTGTHATTKMCIELLEQLDVKDKLIYDVGTGSGILAIASVLLGAAQVCAVDNDRVAVRTARENVLSNKLQQTIEVVEGDLLTGLSCSCDVLIANIIADVIIVMLPDVPAKLKSGGKAIFSGIIADREQDVLAAITAAGMKCVGRRMENSWCALVAEMN